MRRTDHSVPITIVKWTCGYGLTRRAVAEHPASITASRLSLPPISSIRPTGAIKEQKKDAFNSQRGTENKKGEKRGVAMHTGRLVPTFRAEMLNKASSLRPH